MELTPGQRDALTAALHDVRADVRERVLDYAVTSWQTLGDWRDDDIARFVSAVVPQIEAGKRTVAQATDAALSAMLDDDPAGLADLSAIRGGVPALDVYRRPAVAMRSALAEGASMSDAIDRGTVRLASLVKTDLQLAHTHQARQTLTKPARRSARRRAGQVEAFRRVPSGTENCALCLIASTQRYWVGDLMPIHPGCDCGVQSLGKGEHIDQVIDKDLLESVHDQVEGLAGFSDRGGREVDYRQLIVAREHGEYGPTLAWRDQKFTARETIERERERIAIEAPKPVEYPIPGDRWGGTTTTPPVDWLSSGLTRADMEDFPEADLLDFMSEASDVNDPRAYELAAAEMERRSRQASGYRGTGYTRDELRQQYDDYVERTYWEAEAATNGQMLTAAARAAGVSARSLFTGNERTAYANASDDLKYHWQAHPRLTFDAFIGNAEARARAGQTEF